MGIIWDDIRMIVDNKYLRDEIEKQGYTFYILDGVFKSSDDIAVQAIIDTFDPLPYAQAEALELVKEASAKKRLQYVTQAAGKDAEYTFKAQEAVQFGIDGTIGVFMQARMDATGETAQQTADLWNARSAGWKAVGAAIAGLEDKASNDIEAETNWQNCKAIAETIIAQIEAL